MDSLVERRTGSETQLALDRELRFRIQVRRAKLLAQWAAGRRGLAPSQADVHSQIRAGLQMEPRGDRLIGDRVYLDMLRGGHDVPRSLVEREAERCQDVALAEVLEARSVSAAST